MVSANPTGPITVALGAERRVRRLGRAAARVRRHTTSSASTTTTTPARQMDRFRASVEAVRRGEEPPEDGYHGEYIQELAAAPGDPVAAMLRRIEATLERFRVHFDSWERQSELERRLPEAAAAPRHLREGRRALGALVGVRRRGGPRAHPLRERRADLPRGGRRLSRRQARARLRPRDLRPRRRPSRDAQLVRGGRADARLRPEPRRGAALPARAPDRGRRRRRRCRSGAATSSSSTSSSTRSASTRRAGTSSSAGPTRRSRSTSTSPPRSRRRTRSTTCSTRTRGSPGSCATPGDADALAEPLPAPLAAEERELIKRLAEFPAVVAEAAERRGPQAIPQYAIRVADDFHRFYHEHRVLESDQQAFRLALCRATQTVIARCLDLIGVEAPDRM